MFSISRRQLAFQVRTFSACGVASTGKPMSKEAQAFLDSINSQAQVQKDKRASFPKQFVKDNLQGPAVPKRVSPRDVNFSKTMKGPAKNMFRSTPTDGKRGKKFEKQERAPKKINLRQYPFTTGSDNAQKAVQLVINEILDQSAAGEIAYVNDAGKVEEVLLKDFLPQLDVMDYGLSVVVNNQLERPLVKKVPILTAIRKLSDHMADIRAEDMKDNSTYKRSLRMALKKKQKGDVKQVRIGWNISLSDLATKKQRDIVSQLSKGCKVHIYIANKWQLRKMAQGARKQAAESGEATEEDLEDEAGVEEEPVAGKELNELEEYKRAQVLETLLGIVLVYCKPVVEGTIRDQIVIRLDDAKMPEGEEESEKVLDNKELARLKKQERQEKARRIAEEKRAAKAAVL
ncbi:hypothetical protein BABINDRAFT_167741 [Babjeviella inositovora NRRL Y-12698]|uniref:Altered inheritance of mitochondria protein 23, mitochondrial n=1 Tax=Babjeviella inositovora NRRL Y-12698 TaxID=984486 RepID=A0A1E3QND2_9ASCO|nr:uncharacterized protein BABINDRAFT_167741 [Babjeviella inositovora NRRL Y-12698]ODQ79216.1 hypothetical protein BABINDRAFT_167741 [Babjeviella inositovora NRRL Y-12698]